MNTAYGLAGNIDIDGIGGIALRNIESGRDTTINATGDITDVAGSMIDVGQVARFDSGANAIVLGDDPADVVNFGTLHFNGGAVDITEDSDMYLVEDNIATSLRLTAAGSISQSNAGANTVVVENDTVLDALTSIFLRNSNNDFKGRVDASGTFITLGDANDIQLGDVTATENLDVRAFSGQVTDVGTVEVSGITTLEATSDIILDTTTNDFMGRVNSDGVNVVLTDRNSILLGRTTADGNLAVTALDGSITDEDFADVEGLTHLVATGEIMLDSAFNDFSGHVSAQNSTLPHDGSVGFDIALVDRNTLSLDRIVAGRNFSATAGSLLIDKAGSVIDVPYLASLTAGSSITIGDDPADLVNFGHYGVDAFGGDQFGLVVNGGPTFVEEDSAMNFAGTSNVSSLRANSFGDMTDTGEVEVAGASSLKVSAGNSIYLDTKTSAYFGDVGFDTISGSGLINNIRFIDSSDLLLEPLQIRGFLDVAAFALETSSDGAIRSLEGDISLNGYNSLVIGRGGVKGSARVNLAAVDGGFGRRPNQAERSDLKLRGDVESTGGIVSLLAGDRIVYQGGEISTPAGIALMALRGRIGAEDAPLQVDAGGFVTLYQPRDRRFVTGKYDALTMRVHGNDPPDTSPFFEDVFFRGLEVLPPDPPQSETISTCTGPQCDTRTTIEKCVANPAACDVVVVTDDCRDNPNACVPVTIVDCLANPESCLLVPCEGDPKTCGFTPWLERIIGRPYTPVKGNAVARTNESPYEITVCNGVNLFGQNEECNPVNEEAEIFEIETPLYSTERL